jgi:hypothetical protein
VSDDPANQITEPEPPDVDEADERSDDELEDDLEDAQPAADDAATSPEPTTEGAP